MLRIGMAGKGRNKKVIFPVSYTMFYCHSHFTPLLEDTFSASFVNYAVVSTNSPLINIRAISFRNFTTQI